MLAQLDPVPDFLVSLAQENSRSAATGSLDNYDGDMARDVAAFRSDHPMGDLVPEGLRIEAEQPAGRSSPFSRLFASSAKKTQAAVETFRDRKDIAGLRDYTSELVDREASPAHLHWAIVGMHKLGVGTGDPLFDSAMHLFAAQHLPQHDRAIADARLARALGYPGFARLIFRQALTQTRHAKARGAIRRRLASLAAERGRWLDDSNILSTADFTIPVPGRATLLDYARNRSEVMPALAEPAELAFDWLFESGLDDVQHYATDNRLLMVGNTLACGGMERMMARAYRHFSDSDDFDHVDLALLNYADGASSAFYAEEAGVSAGDIVLLGPDGGADLPCALLPPSWDVRAQKLYAYIRDSRPRVIHAWNDLTGLLAAYAGLAAGTPKIFVHFHHMPAVPCSGRAEPIASYPRVYRRLLERPEINILFCANAAATAYAQWWQVKADQRFRTLYNGFEWPGATKDKAAARTAAGINPEASIIGTVMRFSPVKQPLLWAEAAIALAAKAPQTQFLMVGDGPLRADVARHFANAGLERRLHMPGQVDNVADYLAAMDVFWLTSESEGLPNVLIEAQMMKVPVVTFDVGGAGETIQPDISGLLVAPDDCREIAQVSRELLADTDRLARMAEAAAKHAKTKFSAERFFRELAEDYTR